MARRADDLLADLDQLGSEEQAEAHTAKDPSKTTAPPATDDGEDVLADLQAQLSVKPSTSSRPTTPRVSSSTPSATTKSPRRAEHTPASSGPPSVRNSEDHGRRGATGQTTVSGEGRSYHQSTSADGEKSEQTVASSNEGAAAGGWWGSMFSAATAAVKQAETLAKEIRGSEDVQKWADQARGNLSHLQSFGNDLRSRALPTFTSIISHIAPPISAHERLQIHITHDIQNYPSLDPLIYSTFSRVMSQVEGGDLMVIQKGSENRSKGNNNNNDQQGYRGGVLGGSGSGGWTDGPWWRDDNSRRQLGTVAGVKEGSRLARVSAEAYAKEFFDARGGVEEAARKASASLSETNPVRSSDIFLALQAVSSPSDAEWFAGDARSDEAGDATQAAPESKDEWVAFAIYLHDPLHGLSFSTLTQSFPQKWAEWLDASPSGGEPLPASITEVIASGGVDPREWVAEWVEEVLSLGVGIVAQRYVARRMGVGEGALGRGKRRVEEEAAAGEAARAI